MNIFFLGTSAGWPLPRLNCHCPICTSSDPKDKRLRPSILVNGRLQIDAGPDFYHQYQKFKNNFSKLKYIFITHTHPDHYFGLWDLAQIYRRQKIIVFISQNHKSKIVNGINETSINFLLSQSRKIFTHGQLIKLNTNFSITPFLVNHSTTTENYGFLFNENGQKAIYIPDLRTIPKSSLKFCRQVDLAILDGSNFEAAGPEHWGHLPIRESIRLAKKLKIKQVYYTHIGHGARMGIHQQLEEKVQKLGGKRFHLAWDGLELEI